MLNKCCSMFRCDRFGVVQNCCRISYHGYTCFATLDSTWLVFGQRQHRREQWDKLNCFFEIDVNDPFPFPFQIQLVKEATRSHTWKHTWSQHDQCHRCLVLCLLLIMIIVCCHSTMDMHNQQYVNATNTSSKHK